MEGALMASKFVSHTSASETVDGKSGKNNKMERGSSVVSNPIWEPGGPNSPKQRFESPKYASQTSDEGAIGVRETPKNQHGTTGKVEPAHKQPNYKGHNAG
tara:strand:- start:570 stop:872 length:303 start_codon:yes stop_codon:yes gene_type:complete